jgi:hypothetical protein
MIDEMSSGLLEKFNGLFLSLSVSSCFKMEHFILKVRAF